MKEIIVNLNELDTREKLHDYFSSVLETQDWYGRNLDALYDELTSITEPTVIRCRKTEEELPGYTKGLVRVLQDAAAENHNLTVELLPAIV